MLTASFTPLLNKVLTAQLRFEIPIAKVEGQGEQEKKGNAQKIGEGHVFALGELLWKPATQVKDNNSNKDQFEVGYVAQSSSTTWKEIQGGYEYCGKQVQYPRCVGEENESRTD